MTFKLAPVSRFLYSFKFLYSQLLKMNYYMKPCVSLTTFSPSCFLLWLFVRAVVTLTKRGWYHISGILLWQAWPCDLGEDCGRTFDLWAKKAIEFWELVVLFCRSFENRNVENSTGNGGLACELSDKARNLPGFVCRDSVFSCQLYLKNLLWLTGELLK